MGGLARAARGPRHGPHRSLSATTLTSVKGLSREGHTLAFTTGFRTTTRPRSTMRVDLVQLVLTGPAATCVRRLSAEAGFSALAPVTLTRSWLDSFDHRLYRNGEVVEVEHGGNGITLRGYRCETGRTHGRALQIQAPPRFARDLPGGALRKRIGPVIGNRALLVQAHCRCRAVPLERRDGDGKVVLLAAIERWQVLDEAGRNRGRALSVLRLQPVKGHRSALRRVLASLDVGDDAWLHPLDAVLPRLGKVPAAYDPRLSLRFEQDEDAGTATRRLLLALLDMVQANVPGTLEDIDPEFLHELRVAVRRTRTVLGELKRVLPTGGPERFRDGFAWVGQVTGPSRDLDVYLAHLAEYRALLPAGRRQDLEPLFAFLQSRKLVERQQLVRALTGKRFRRLLDDWRQWLVNSPQNAPVRAREPAPTIASRRIWRRYRRVRKAGREIGADTPPEALHELRIACKKLRYLMEFFASLYPPREHRRLVKVLKALQDNLGTFQDCEIQAATLTGFTRQMQAAGEVPPSMLEAVGILLADLERRQAEARADFHRRFADFDTDSNRKRFRALFRRK